MPRTYVVPDKLHCPKVEEEILAEWRKNQTFKKSLELTAGKKHFTFYDGPPFATGLPHYGHILAGTIKDVVTRFMAQNGFHVERRFGWDTHGLPVEFEVDKILGIKGPADVIEMGIGNYNRECRSIVMRYASEWKEAIERTGRWIDFENDYKTLYPTFMESVWWVFSQLHKKNLVYQGVKVMPYSTGCSTPLSNFEANQNYKTVKDKTAFVAFPLRENPNRRLIAWTTTPWTLPSNLALCVHPDLEYVVVCDTETGFEYVLLESCLGNVYKLDKKDDKKAKDKKGKAGKEAEAKEAVQFIIIGRFPGSALEGKKYIPLFDYFCNRDNGNFFQVLTGKFVETDQGTGIVHQAPYFGEIDYSTCLEHGIITKEMDMICPINEKGCFTDEVPDFAGEYVKTADALIIRALKEKKLIVKVDEVNHSYPFCYRSDTPLLYKAVPSWFIRVEQLVPRLLANNEQTYWVPNHVKEGRFANWLRDARDWAVSRNRFWGTPINLWVSEDGKEVVCPGSIAELEELTGEKITDLHRESIDHLTIPSKQGKGNLKRVSEVFDCWFESGSMPYASQHYPFEDKVKFEENFPADFIAEGIDQTRGWFYTLLVLSTALFDKPPFKNLICNGLVLAADGEKMSKRKKNYPDPMEVAHNIGADPLRLYLVSSPAVRGEELRFREEGVKDVLKDVFLPWFNAYRLFFQNVAIYEEEHQTNFNIDLSGIDNVVDRWILSFTNSLVKFVRQEMSAYRLSTVANPLMKYFESLTNCYIRLNRKRFKGDGNVLKDRLAGLSTLGHVLCTITRLMAPFTPFFCEYLWKELRRVSGHTEESVHFTMIPEVEEQFIDNVVERRVAAMRSTIENIRILREKKGVSTRYPLREIVVVNRSQEYLDDLQALKSYILSECNVRNLTTSSDKVKYGVVLKAIPSFKLLGERLGKNQKDVVVYLRSAVTQDELEKLLSDEKLAVQGHEVTIKEVDVVYTVNPAMQQSGSWETHCDKQSVVMLDCEMDDSMIEEGLTREIINRVQLLRKGANMFPTQRATAHINFVTPASILESALNGNLLAIESQTNTALLKAPSGAVPNPSGRFVIRENEIEFVLLPS